MKKIINILLLVIVVLCCSSCSKKPKEIYYQNMKNFNYIDSYNYRKAYNAVMKDGKPEKDYFVDISNFTEKPGIIWGVYLEDKIGTSKAKIQLMDAISSGIIESDERDINPDMTSIMNWINLPGKGKYKINLIANDKIIAQGEIEYK